MTTDNELGYAVKNENGEYFRYLGKGEWGWLKSVSKATLYTKDEALAWVRFFSDRGTKKVVDKVS